MIANKKYFCASLLIAAVTLLLDQASKWWALDVVGLASRPPIEVTGFFNLVLVWNHGISFGMLSGHRLPLVLIALALVIVAVLLKWLASAHNRLMVAGIGLVIGGALGNVIDRARFGAVADFLDFHLYGMHWPAFNIADSAIFMGVVVLCIESIMHAPKKRS
ncbi:MAG: signal peptidase II [Alphaproteobacteria bacterium]|nr:signal peptidase II [Alphaproteobacteria bacterium]